jgi:hypothetical protein
VLEKKGRKYLLLHGVIGWLGLVVLSLAVIGCVIPFQQGTKQGDRRPQLTAENRQQAKPTRLIHPRLASESPGPAQVGAPAPKSAVPKQEEKPLKPEPAPAQRKVWEDQKVKAAAQEMAKSFPAVRKIQVCYQIEADEWWVALCDDMGPEIDMKQFTWNREQEKLEPFLVVKRIPASRLETHLATKRPGMACETLEPPEQPSSRRISSIAGGSNREMALPNDPRVGGKREVDTRRHQ